MHSRYQQWKLRTCHEVKKVKKKKYVHVSVFFRPKLTTVDVYQLVGPQGPGGNLWAFSNVSVHTEWDFSISYGETHEPQSWRFVQNPCTRHCFRRHYPLELPPELPMFFRELCYSLSTPCFRIRFSFRDKRWGCYLPTTLTSRRPQKSSRLAPHPTSPKKKNKLVFAIVYFSPPFFFLHFSSFPLPSFFSFYFFPHFLSFPPSPLSPLFPSPLSPRWIFSSMCFCSFTIKYVHVLWSRLDMIRGGTANVQLWMNKWISQPIYFFFSGGFSWTCMP